MSMPTDSAIKMTPALEAKLQGASFEQIKSIMADAAVTQGLVQRDQFDPSVLHPVEGASIQKIGKTVVFNGKSYDLIADDAAGLLAQENELYRQAFESTTTVNDPARDERGRFVERQQTDAERQAEAVRQSDLELRWKLGQITSDQYLSESGAIERHLASQGIDTDALKEVSQGRVVRSWEEATQDFLQGAGKDWPGGEENLKIAHQLLQENDLDNSPSAETLAAVWNHMKANNLVAENPELVKQQRLLEQENLIKSANSPEAIRAALGRSSSLFF